MAPVVIDVNGAEDTRDVVHRAVEALAAGKLVAFPTETVYGVAASALNPDAVEHLIEAKGRAANNPFTLAIKSADDAQDYVPGMSPLAYRLARRCWPGPVTLVLRDNCDDSLTRQLPPTVKNAVCPNGTIGLRVPHHPLILDVLRISRGPLALTSANRSGQKDAVTAKQVVDALGDNVELVLDDGKCKFGQPSSVIQIEDHHCKLLRSGVINAQTLRRLMNFMALIVCTGNTCRSPMAEALLKKRFADRLQVDMDQLEDAGVLVMSAGLAASSGSAATMEAHEAVKSRGLDLSQHASQPISERLVNYADLILTMTRGHRDAILTSIPAASGRTHLLCRDGADVSDPIGGPPELYERCAAQIDSQLEEWVNTLDLEQLVCTEVSGA